MQIISKRKENLNGINASSFCVCFLFNQIEIHQSQLVIYIKKNNQPPVLEIKPP